MMFSSVVLPFCFALGALAHAAPTARIDVGEVIGTTTSLPAASATVNKFLGIPFAQSPPERFTPPKNPAHFAHPLEATAFKPACIQEFVYPLASQEFVELVFDSPAPAGSEDCLYLNVFAPGAPAAGAGRAVMFWIYGGSLEFGDAGLPTYDGSHFAAYQDVIVVSTNYRTNVFGFPNSPELEPTERNLGFLDQRAALDWVQRNIHAFGGDPEKVTIFGESAGAFSVDALLTSFPKNSKPPFRAAILESGQVSYRTDPGTAQGAVGAWYNLTATLDCPGHYRDNLTCVRAANVSTIRQAIDVNELAFSPFPDNVTLMAYPAAQRNSGDIACIPVMGGTNAQEGRAFTVGQTNTTAYLEVLFGGNAALIAATEAAYPLGQNGIETVYDQLSQIFTEFFFQCPQAEWANATAAIGIPAWRYYYNASFANNEPYPGLGVYHSSEIPLVFGTYATANTTTQEYALSSFMNGAWARFAKNPAGGPGWNAVGTASPSLVLSGAAAIVPGGAYENAAGAVTEGAFDLGLLGTVGDVLASGVTVIPQSLVDYRCGLFTQFYNYVNEFPASAVV